MILISGVMSGLEQMMSKSEHEESRLYISLTCLKGLLFVDKAAHDEGTGKFDDVESHT